MSIIFIDTHCHLNSENYELSAHDIIDQAQAQGICKMISICTKKEEIDEIIALTDFSAVYGSVGIHPHESQATLERMSDQDLKNWLRYHCLHKKIIAIGETGLDFYYHHSHQDLQEKCFQYHIDIALETDLPLSVHTRDAESETVAILSSNPNVKGVIHCFSGSSYLAEQALNLGFYISISGIITFKKSEELRRIIKEIPLDRLMLETDSPFLAPMPYRGKKNQPAFLIETAKIVAELKEISLEELAEITTNNFYTLFKKAQNV